MANTTNTTATGATPAANTTTPASTADNGMTGMRFAKPVLDEYYRSIIKELPANTIDRAVISTPEQTTASIAEQVKSYLQPQYDMSVRQRQEQTKQNQAAIDVDSASRGMGASTWTSDSKSRQLMAEASDVANLGSNYTSTLAQQVASQYESYLNRKAGIDEANANNQIEVDKWNSQVKTALEELAYSRALQEYQRSPGGRNPSGGTGGGGGSGTNSGYLPMAQYRGTNLNAWYRWANDIPAGTGEPSGGGGPNYNG